MGEPEPSHKMWARVIREYQEKALREANRPKIEFPRPSSGGGGGPGTWTGPPTVAAGPGKPWVWVVMMGYAGGLGGGFTGRSVGAALAGAVGAALGTAALILAWKGAGLALRAAFRALAFVLTGIGGANRALGRLPAWTLAGAFLGALVGAGLAVWLDGYVGIAVLRVGGFGGFAGLSLGTLTLLARLVRRSRRAAADIPSGRA